MVLPRGRASLQIDIVYWMIQNAKKRAKKKCIKFDLTRDFILSLNSEQNGKCAITGIKLNWNGQDRAIKKGLSPFNRASLDRIDSSKGYTEDNVQLVADFVNRMKYQLSKKELLSSCQLILEHNKQSHSAFSEACDSLTCSCL